MQPESPYLWEGGPREAVAAVADAETGIIEVTVCGHWGREVWMQSYRALAKCLAGHPAGIVIDLHRLRDPRAGSASLWLTARAQGGGMQPPVPVVVALTANPLAARLARLGGRRHLPVLPTVEAARAELLRAGPSTDRVRLRFPAALAATAPARQVVAEACVRWRLEDLVHHGRLVVTELVANAVQHAGTPIEVVIARTGTASRTLGLWLAVYDGDSRLPQRPKPGETSLSQPGLGLRVVDKAAQAWGALPTRCGKLVWASLRR